MSRSFNMYLLAAVVSGVCTWVPAAAQEISTVASSSAVSAALTPFEANSPASSELVAPATPGSESLLLSVRAGMRISPVMQARIPLRVHSMDGIPGDVVNFLFIGNKHDMKKAMDRAGWNTVACTKLGVIWRDLFASLYIKSYRGIPMTKLYLFGRQQDYGFAHSRGLLSVRNRHHFRIWLAPFQVDGQSLWIGAGTHDVALHYVGRFLHFIHKIDPNVDAERQYISSTLTQSGRAEVLGYLTTSDTLTDATTTTGQEFYTDGRIVVLQAATEKSADGIATAINFSQPSGNAH